MFKDELLPTAPLLYLAHDFVVVALDGAADRIGELAVAGHWLLARGVVEPLVEERVAEQEGQGVLFVLLCAALTDERVNFGPLRRLEAVLK